MTHFRLKQERPELSLPSPFTVDSGAYGGGAFSLKSSQLLLVAEHMVAVNTDVRVCTLMFM